MAEKIIPANPNPIAAAQAAGNVDLVSNTTSYQGLLDGPNSDLRSRLWSELVTRDAREKNVFAKFIGGEGSGKPITEKRDLSAGGSDKVTFTTVAPIRGQGVRGESILKNATDTLDFGTFSIEVDLVRHAVSWTQVLKLMRFTGKTIDQLSAEVMSEWMSRTEQDQIQYSLRQICLNTGGNLISGYGTGANGELKYVDGLSTDIIQEAKQALIANGGEPMSTGGDINQEIPGYLFFAPDACLRPLRSDPDYLEAITQADARSDNNKLYNGSYAKWDNNIIANHNVLIDTARGRQGSPLLPTFYAYSAIADASQLIGDTNGDFMANFRGAFIDIPGGGGADLVEEAGATYYILGIDTDGSVALYSYDAAAAAAAGDFSNISGVSLNRADNAQAGNANDIFADGTSVKADNAFSAGALFVQANALGTPIGYALAMGKDAMYYAKGKIYGEQIFHYDDFANSGNEAHLSAVGVQSVYGMGARKDTRGRVPSVQLVEVVRQVPGLSLTQA